MSALLNFPRIANQKISAGILSMLSAPERKEARSRALMVAGVGVGDRPVDMPVSPQDYADLYTNNPTVYRCVTLNASHVAMGRMRAYGWDEAGKEKKEITSGPLIKLLETVNNYQTQTDLLRQITSWCELTGNAYIEIEKKNGKAVALHVVKSTKMKVIPGTSGPSGYSLEVDGKRTRFAADEIFHAKYPDPDNDWYGVSWLVSAKRSIVASGLQERLVTAVLKNGARPNMAMFFEPGTDDAILDSVEQSLVAMNAGVDNAGKTLLVPNGRDVKPFAWSMNDLQNESLAKMIREVMITNAGIPILVFGSADTSATRENATVQRKLYFESTISSRATLLSDQATELLIPKLGFTPADMGGYPAERVQLVLDYSQSRFWQEIQAEEAASRVLLLDRNVQSVNEVRQLMGLDPVQEQVRQRFSGIQATSAMAIVTAVAASQIPRDSGIGQLQAYFNLTEPEAESIMGSAGLGFVPAGQETANG